MEQFIKKLLRESLLKESIEAINVNDIENDNLYDDMLAQSQSLLNNSSELSFGQAEIFDVLLDNGTVIGGTWVDTSGTFSFHILISPEYRNKGFSKILLNNLFKKYQQMLSYRGDDYKIRVNVTNDKLASNLAKHYGLKVIGNEANSVIMSN